MQAQIEIKDKQIEHLSFLLAQAQDEKKQLLLISERPKKRWWLFRRK
jgi:dsDNA-binding SOS-regulon protein